jgi:high-affinity iron transporter
VVTAGLAVTTVVSVVPLTPAASAGISRPDRLRGQRITVTTTTCAPHWHAPNAGRDHFMIENDSHVAATMLLFHPASGVVVATAKSIKPGKSRELVVRLRRGKHYMWGCDLSGRPPRSSEVETVPVDPTHGGSGHPVVPVTRDQLVAPMKAYRHYVSQQLAILTTQVSRLTTDLGAADPAAARSAWLSAHLTWLRIGQDDGAYSAFGQSGRAIDGTAAGLVRGTSDPRFTGFHKIELELWTDHNLPAAATAAAHLMTSITSLTKRSIASWFPLSTAGVSGLPLRCHEVLEDALRDTLSGDDDYGSGTGFASVHADVSGTRELLGLLAPLLDPRSAHLVARAHHALSRLDSVLDATRSHGSWVAVADVSRAKREAVDSAAGAAVEILAPVPDLLTIGRS